MILALLLTTLLCSPVQVFAQGSLLKGNLVTEEGEEEFEIQIRWRQN
jgi:hypothetical protein